MNPETAQALALARGAACRIETPPNWRFRCIEVEVRMDSESQEVVTFVHAVWRAVDKRGRLTVRRGVGHYLRSGDVDHALRELTALLDDPGTRRPWKRLAPVGNR